jgi:hypothetical protein
MPSPAHESAPEAEARKPLEAPAAATPDRFAARMLGLQRTAGNAAVGRLLRATLARDTVTPPRSASFEERLRAWRSLRNSSMATAAEKRAAATAALDALQDSEDVMREGMAMVRELFDDGLDDLAQRALDRVESSWTLRAVLQPRDDTPDEVRRANVPGAGWLGSPEAALLISRAERAARDDNHQLVSSLLTRAALFIQMQIIRESAVRDAELQDYSQRFGNEAGGLASITRTMFTYPTVRALYDQLRSIFAFYPRLERERLAASDPVGAARMGGLGIFLRDAIRERFTWSGHAMLAEVSQVETRRGPALRMHGDNIAEEDLTQLPGLPSPREVGAHSFQWQEMGEVMNALMGQVDLTEELWADPEVAREFPDGNFQMIDDAHRARIWNAMFRSLRRRPGGDTLALESLIRLMERYLRAFTIHTAYNIRDFGRNYLDSTMPTDLAGRAERDCGVYALTVAYDLYRMARAASPRINLRFELMAMPEHVSLVIHDTDRDRFFVANNDQISGPFTGSVEAPVARLYAGVRGHMNMVVPAINMELGSTAQGDRAFRNQVWDRYQDATAWEISSPPGQREETYRALYQLEHEFDEGTTALEPALDRLAAATTPGDERTRLTQGLERLAPRYRRLAQIFEGLGPAAPITADARRRGILERLRGRKRFLYHSATPNRPHPLVRAGMAVLRLRHLGATLAPEDDEFITRLERIQDFRTQLDAYRTAGFPAQF